MEFFAKAPYNPDDPNDVGYRTLQDPVANLRAMCQHTDTLLYLRGNRNLPSKLMFNSLSLHVSNTYELTEAEAEDLSSRGIHEQLSDEELSYWLERLKP